MTNSPSPSCPASVQACICRWLRAEQGHSTSEQLTASAIFGSCQYAFGAASTGRGRRWGQYTRFFIGSSVRSPPIWQVGAPRAPECVLNTLAQLRLRPLRSLISSRPSCLMASRMLSSLVPTPTLDLSNPARARSSRQNTRTASVSNDLPVPPLTRTADSLEYASLRHTGHCPLGMYVAPSPDNLMVWDAVFFVHQGTRPLCHLVLPAWLTARSVQVITPTPY